MKSILFRLLTSSACLLCLCSTGWLNAASCPQDEQEQTQQESEATDKQADETPASKFAAITAKYDEAMQEFRKAYSAAEDDEARQKVFTEQYPQPADFAGDMLELAKSHADDPTAFDALMWVVTRARQGKEVDQAVAVLMADHIENEKMGDICSAFMYGMPSKKNEEALRKIMSASPHDNVKGRAMFSLAYYLNSLMQAKQAVEGDPAMAERYKAAAGPDGDALLEYLQNASVSEARLEELYQAIIDKYADVEMRPDVTLGSRAEAALFEIKYLSIGKVAPDIEGSDLDGVEFKLSDYRGKVVVLDFWGDW